MTVNTAYNPFNQPVDLNGAVLSGAKWYFYENGTTTLKDVYQDQAKTSTHANPVIADANGRFPDIWLEGVYSIRIAQSDDTWITGTQMDDYNKGFSDVDAAATAGSTLTDFEYDAANSSGLNFKVNDGTVDNLDGTTTTITTSALALSQSTTNYVYIRLWDNTVVGSTAAPGKNTVLLYQVVTDTSSIITVTDKRPSQVKRQVTPQGYLHGFIVTINSSDTNHDIDIEAGVARDSLDNYDIRLSSTITKQIDATWVEGNNMGGMATDGVSTLLANDTMYNIFAIVKADTTVDIGFDTSASAGNLLTNDATDYIAYRKIGEFMVDSSSNLHSITLTIPDESKINPRALIERVTLSGSSGYSINLPYGYRYFELFCENMTVSGSTVPVLLRVGNDGSVDSGATDYRTDSAGSSDTDRSSFLIAPTYGSGVAANGSCAMVTIFNPLDENYYTHMVASISGAVTAGGSALAEVYSGFRKEAAAHDIIEVSAGAATLSGTFSLYGVK